MTHEQNHAYTMNRLKHLVELGNTVYYIWISDFNKYANKQIAFEQILNLC